MGYFGTTAGEAPTTACYRSEVVCEQVMLCYPHIEDIGVVGRSHGFIHIHATTIGSLPGSNPDQHCLVFSACERGTGCY